jgi:hypothetical protein
MENPNAVHKTPLHPIKIEVWCVRHKIAQSLFFENAINSECYIDIIRDFVRQVTEKKIAKAWFQKDSTTCYSVQTAMFELSPLFGD